MSGRGRIRRVPGIRPILDIGPNRVFLADAVGEHEDRSHGESEGEAPEEAAAARRRGHPSAHAGIRVSPIRISASRINRIMKTSSM